MSWAYYHLAIICYITIINLCNLVRFSVPKEYLSMIKQTVEKSARITKVLLDGFNLSDTGTFQLADTVEIQIQHTPLHIWT